MWNNIETVRSLARIATWLTVILSGLGVLSGVVRLLADGRVRELERIRKESPLNVEARACYTAAPGGIRVAIAEESLLPFECKWMLCTKNNTVVGGIQLEWVKVFPTKEQPGALYRDRFDPTKVVDGHVELRLEFRSPYAAEVKKPGMEGHLVIPVEQAPPDA